VWRCSKFQGRTKLMAFVLEMMEEGERGVRDCETGSSG
jgi:hypothetical protein